MARSLQDFLLSRSDVPESVLNSCAVLGDYLEVVFCVWECSEENHRLFQKIKSRTLCTGKI